MSSHSEDFEYFEYPASWEENYLATRTVSDWTWHRPGKRRPGTLLYFAQYALMHLLDSRYGIGSLTWIHLASVDKRTRTRLEAGQPWEPASPAPSKDAAKTQKRIEKWRKMRTLMGGTFDRLQEAIVRADFSVHKGEPDLFCCVDDRTWFFAEAKREGEPVLASQEKWFAIAENLPGGGCPIYRCRLVPEGYRRSASQPQHTVQWDTMIAKKGSVACEPCAGTLYVD